MNLDVLVRRKTGPQLLHVSPHAFETPQHRKRKDDLAVIGLPVIAAQEVGDRPDEGGEGLVIHGRLTPGTVDLLRDSRGSSRGILPTD